jgi:hypothetical protein
MWLPHHNDCQSWTCILKEVVLQCGRSAHTVKAQSNMLGDANNTWSIRILIELAMKVLCLFYLAFNLGSSIKIRDHVLQLHNTNVNLFIMFSLFLYLFLSS